MTDLFIILTSAEADAFRGPTSPGAALEPMPLADGDTFVLPAAVLSDPDHGPAHEALSALPCREVLPGEWPVPPLIELT